MSMHKGEQRSKPRQYSPLMIKKTKKNKLRRKKALQECPQMENMYYICPDIEKLNNKK